MASLIKQIFTTSIKYNRTFICQNFSRNISINGRLNCCATDPHDTAAVSSKPRVEYDTEAHMKVLHQTPDSPVDSRLLRVAMVGVPNSGKSTLTNSLVEAPVCDVSNKVHTTICTTSAIMVRNNVQVIFLDTPGLVRLGKAKKYDMDPNVVSDPNRSLEEADLLVVVADMSAAAQRLELPYILGHTLHLYRHKPSILVLNKVDQVKAKRKLLESAQLLTQGKVGGQVSHKDRSAVTRRRPPTPNLEELFTRTSAKLEQLSQTLPDTTTASTDPDPSKSLKISSWPHFSQIFMISGLHNDGVDRLRDYLVSQAVPAHWLHHSSVLTTTGPHTLAKMAVRARFMHHLYRNIPYLLDFRIRDWRFTANNVLDIKMDVVCPQESLIKFVVGENGERVQAVNREASQSLVALFQCPVDLNLLVVAAPRRSR